MSIYKKKSLPKPSNLTVGDAILFEEDVFVQNSPGFSHAGKRAIAIKITGNAIPGYAAGTVIRSSGLNAPSVGTKISRPVPNLMKGYLVNDHAEELEFKAGGHLEGIQNGKKVVLPDATKGGISVGARHSGGGIKGVVDGQQQIEVEDQEPHIVPEASQNPKEYTLDGKKMKAHEILSTLNQDSGGKAFAQGGEAGTKQNPLEYRGGTVILTRDVATNPQKHEFDGQQLTARQIASQINVNNGGVAFADGGETPGSIKCSGREYQFGGKTMKDHDIANHLCGCQH